MTERSSGRRRPSALAWGVRLGWVCLAVGSLRAAERLEGPSDAQPALIVVLPGAPGSTDAAAAHMAQLGAYLDSKRGVDAAKRDAEVGRPSAPVYYNEPDPALETIRRARPSWGIVSVGFYLAHREAFGLRAVAEILPEAPLHLVAAKDGDARKDGLAGKEVAGGVFYEDGFASRVAFPDLPGVAEWKGAPTTNLSRALRRLASGRHAAVVVPGREYRVLEDTGRLDKVREIARSEPFPAALFVVFDVSDAEPQGRAQATAAVMVKALGTLGEDEAGRKILDWMGCEGTRPVREEWLGELERKFAGKEEKK